jgi:hypothetical protein
LISINKLCAITISPTQDGPMMSVFLANEDI